MRLNLLLPAMPETGPVATDDAPLDPRARDALIKLLGRAIDVVGEAEARALAPALVACLTGPTAPAGAGPLPATR